MGQQTWDMQANTSWETSHGVEQYAGDLAIILYGYPSDRTAAPGDSSGLVVYVAGHKESYLLSLLANQAALAHV